eukprot:ANDGO_02769.mRNA.1 hypothetical protein
MDAEDDEVLLAGRFPETGVLLRDLAGSQRRFRSFTELEEGLIYVTPGGNRIERFSDQQAIINDMKFVDIFPKMLFADSDAEAPAAVPDDRLLLDIQSPFDPISDEDIKGCSLDSAVDSSTVEGSSVRTDCVILDPDRPDDVSELPSRSELLPRDLQDELFIDELLVPENECLLRPMSPSNDADSLPDKTQVHVIEVAPLECRMSPASSQYPSLSLSPPSSAVIRGQDVPPSSESRRSTAVLDLNSTVDSSSCVSDESYDDSFDEDEDEALIEALFLQPIWRKETEVSSSPASFAPLGSASDSTTASTDTERPSLPTNQSLVASPSGISDSSASQISRPVIPRLANLASLSTMESHSPLSDRSQPGSVSTPRRQSLKFRTDGEAVIFSSRSRLVRTPTGDADDDNSSLPPLPPLPNIILLDSSQPSPVEVVESARPRKLSSATISRAKKRTSPPNLLLPREKSPSSATPGGPNPLDSQRAKSPVFDDIDYQPQLFNPYRNTQSVSAAASPTDHRQDLGYYSHRSESGEVSARERARSHSPAAQPSVVPMFPVPANIGQSPSSKSRISNEQPVPIASAHSPEASTRGMPHSAAPTSSCPTFKLHQWRKEFYSKNRGLIRPSRHHQSSLFVLNGQDGFSRTGSSPAVRDVPVSSLSPDSDSPFGSSAFIVIWAVPSTPYSSPTSARIFLFTHPSSSDPIFMLAGKVLEQVVAVEFPAEKKFLIDGPLWIDVLDVVSERVIVSRHEVHAVHAQSVWSSNPMSAEEVLKLYAAKSCSSRTLSPPMSDANIQTDPVEPPAKKGCCSLM